MPAHELDRSPEDHILIAPDPETRFQEAIDREAAGARLDMLRRCAAAFRARRARGDSFARPREIYHAVAHDLIDAARADGGSVTPAQFRLARTCARVVWNVAKKHGLDPRLPRRIA
jgi:hypothetical protein